MVKALGQKVKGPEALARSVKPISVMVVLPFSITILLMAVRIAKSMHNTMGLEVIGELVG